MSEGNGRDVRQNRVARNWSTGFSASFQHLVQLPGVVGNDGIGEQGQRAADNESDIAWRSAVVRFLHDGDIRL